MIRLIARRLLWTIPLFFVVSFLSFLLASLAPGSTEESILGLGATPEALAELRQRLGLDEPMLVQYWNWLLGALRGDLGVSVYDGRDVIDVIISRLPPTLALTFLSLTFIVLIGSAIGMFTAYQGGPVARALDSLAIVVRGIPNFWLALVFVAVFAVNLRWFPVSGYVPLGESPLLWAQSLVLPIIALGVGQIAVIAIIVRAELLVVFRADFIRALRANGVSSKRILFRHCVKNAAGPVLTIVSLLFVGILGGTILIETVFAIAGMGSQMVSSVALHDLPVIQGLVVFYTVVVVIVFLVNDIAQASVNPKVVAR